MKKVLKFEDFDVNEAIGTYKEFVKKLLAKYKVKSPSEIKDRATKARFFKNLDNGWESKAEKSGKK